MGEYCFFIIMITINYLEIVFKESLHCLRIDKERKKLFLSVGY